MRMRLVAPMLAGALLLNSVAASAARADPIDDKRQQAAAIADQLNTLRTDAEILAERYNATVEQLHQLDVQRQAALDQLAAATTAAAATRLQIKEWALRTFVFSGTGASNDPLLSLLEETPGTDQPNKLSLRQGLTDIAVGKDQALIDAYRRTSDDALRAKVEVDAAEADQQVVQAQLAVDRTNVEKATADQQDLLAKTEGELQTLIIEEQQRRAAEEERRVKERLAAEAAKKAAAEAEAARKAEEARRATSTTATTAAPTTAKPATPTSAKAATTTAVPPPSSGGPPALSPSTTTAPTTATTAAPPATTAPPPAPPVRASAAAAVAAATSMLGVKYQWGGDSPATGFDCSGLMFWAWGQAGRFLPHNAAEQYNALPKVPIADLQPGDLVFFGKDLHHDGMYIGNGQMIHAPFTGDVVRIATIYRADLVIYGARP